MSANVITIFKKIGETPLEALNRLRMEMPEYAEATLSYAGRLDPLAEGELLVLVGEANKRRSEYLGLDKTYTIDVLFGIATDTGDLLGTIAAQASVMPSAYQLAHVLPAILNTFEGQRRQTFPMYSSKPYSGRPLYAHARAGEALSHEERPAKDVTIYNIQLGRMYSLSAKELVESAINRILTVSGDFRQNEIMAGWKAFLMNNTEKVYPVATITVKCSAGTYMRVLAEEIGSAIDVLAVAYTIRRDKVHLK